jgi:hypothetical protein
MSPWLVHLVAASQIVVFYWLTITRMQRVVDVTFFHKNPGWLAANPSVKAALAAPPWVRTMFYLAGAGWLGALLNHAWRTDGLPTDGLSADFGWQVWISVAPTLAYLVLVGLYATLQYQRTNKTVPLAAKRRAPFQRRALRDFVHPFWSTLCFALYALELAVFVGAWYRNTIELRVLVGALIGIGGIVSVSAGSLLYALRRRDQPVDELWGPMYRKLEVIGIVLTAYACQVVVVSTMMTVFFSAIIFPMVPFVVAVNLTLQALTLFFCTNWRANQLLAAG